MHRLELAPRAQRELEQALELARGAPLAPDTAVPVGSPIRLKGPLYSLSVGSYRIVYAVLDREQLVVALKIARGEEDGRPRLQEPS